ncbi:MAG: hypothetical protein U1F77_07880 [Kiritimatiellia bacterium]
MNWSQRNEAFDISSKHVHRTEKDILSLEKKLEEANKTRQDAGRATLDHHQGPGRGRDAGEGCGREAGPGEKHGSKRGRGPKSPRPRARKLAEEIAALRGQHDAALKEKSALGTSCMRQENFAAEQHRGSRNPAQQLAARPQHEGSTSQGVQLQRGSRRSPGSSTSLQHHSTRRKS